MRTKACGREGSTATRRRQAAAKAPPVLSPDDRDALRRLTAAAQHVLHVVLEDTLGRKELLRAAFNVAEQATVWHRRIKPGLYGREAGGAP